MKCQQALYFQNLDMLTVAVITGIFLSGFLVARFVRVAALRRIARMKVSLADGSKPFTARQAARYTANPAAGAEMAAYGSVTLAELLWDWFTIDPALVRATDFSSVEQITNGLDFARYIHNSYDTLPAAAKDGFLARLSGYLAEQHIATAMEKAGHVVQAAETANQPIWDLLIDGQAVNVKNVTDLAAIKADALAHPDVLYFVPDHLEHTATLDNVHPVPGFDHDVIQESVKDGIASAHGEGALDGMGVHLPIVTIGFAAYRNYKLVRDYGQEPIVAVSHGVVESVSRGAGVVAGGKIGASAGFAIGGPVGAIIGGIGMGIMGAIAGGAVAERIKGAPLRAAAAELESELRRFGESFKYKIPTIRELIQAPVRRAESARQRVSDELRARRSSWKQRLWPDLPTVILAESLRVADTTAVAERERASASISRLNQIERTNDWHTLGVVMANTPILRNHLGYDKALMDRIFSLRSKVLKERKRLNLKLNLS